MPTDSPGVTTVSLVANVEERSLDIKSSVYSNLGLMRAFSSLVLLLALVISCAPAEDTAGTDAADRAAAEQAAPVAEAARVVKEARAGTVFRECEACPEMVVIPAGRFRMGCVSGQKCQRNEQPVHEVTVASFALGRYEVTVEEYDRFTAATGRARADDLTWGRGSRPVIESWWEAAQVYVAWLSAETGASYRLPSEAEWEYAARAGTETMYSWGNEIGDNRANCGRCGSRWDRRQTAPVGSFGANAWGLYDMHGNVIEWVEDCWHENYEGAPSDGTAWTSGGDCRRRVLRGGWWLIYPRNLRSAYRDRLGITSQYRSNHIGFRVARTLTP